MTSSATSTSDPARGRAGASGATSERASRAARRAALLAHAAQRRVSAAGRRTLERWSSRVARRNLALLVARGNISETLSDVPEQMHRVARQTALVIEFVDDFRSGRYRAVPWWAVAVAVTAMAYTVNPVDVIPNAIPIAGVVDDLAVVAVATRVLRRQLLSYCEFKGYDAKDYF